jgi:hypothetical protein
MNMDKQLITLLILLLMLSGFPLWAANYYIATNGADGNSGVDVNHPWAPDARAWTGITSGSVVSFNCTNIFTNITFWCTANNVLFTSYGTSNTIITNGTPGPNSYGCCTFTNLSGIVLSNLCLDAPRPDTNDDGDNGQYGTVYFTAYTTNNTLYTNDNVINCRVTGAGWTVYYLAGYQNFPDGFTNSGVFGCTISNGWWGGFTTQVQDWGSGNPIIPTNPEFQNCYFISNDVSLCLGGTAYPSGSGVVPYCANGMLIRGNRVHDCGMSNNFSGSGGGPGGIYLASSENCVTASNEIFHIYTRTSGITVDGSGFGPDESSVSNLFEYNHSHDNQGAGAYTYNGPYGGGKNIFRFNSLSNNASVWGAEFVLQGDTNDILYNNTVISAHQTISSTETGDGFTNNILDSPNSTLALNGSPFVNNLVYTPASIGLPPWMNSNLQLYYAGPGVLSACYIPGNGSVDYWGTNVDNYAFNIGAVNSTWGGTNLHLAVKAPQFGP